MIISEVELGRGGHRDWGRGRGGEDLVQVWDAEVHPGHQHQPRVLRVLVTRQPGGGNRTEERLGE